jgi:hypothetical protein
MLCSAPSVELSPNQLSTISRHDIITGKEDEIVEEIIVGSAQGAPAIENTRYLVSGGSDHAGRYPALRANHAPLEKGSYGQAELSG